MRFRAKIKKVGSIIEHPDGSFEPKGFAFDGCGKAVMIEIDRDGVFYVAGWSIADLQEVVKRPSEFVDAELPS